MTRMTFDNLTDNSFLSTLAHLAEQYQRVILTILQVGIAEVLLLDRDPLWRPILVVSSTCVCSASGLRLSLSVDVS